MKVYVEFCKSIPILGVEKRISFRYGPLDSFLKGIRGDSSDFVEYYHISTFEQNWLIESRPIKFYGKFSMGTTEP